MSDTEPTFVEKIKKDVRYWGIIAGIVIAAFLIGLVPMWFTANNRAAERDAALTNLRRSEISNLLSSSIVDARRGEYETARQKTSEFFTRLRAEDEKADNGFLSADQRLSVKTMFVDRDPLITMLAQRDQASLDRLTDLYIRYFQTVPLTVAVASPTSVPAR